MDAALHLRRVPWPPVRHYPLENATAISLVGSFPTATSAKLYIPPPPPSRTPWGEPGFKKEHSSTRKEANSLFFLFSLLPLPIIALLLLLFFKSCRLANYLFVDRPRRKKAKQEWKDSTKGMDEKQLASHGRIAEARTQLYGYVRDCEQTISMKEYNRRDETKFFRNLDKDNKRIQRQKELRVQRNLQSVVRHDFGPSEYVVVDLEHQERTEWTVYDTYIDNSHPTPRRAIVLTADGPPTQDTSPSSPPCTAESSSSSSSSFPSSSPSPPCRAISSSSPCCVVSESSSSSCPLSSPSCDQCSLCYSSSTGTGCSTPPTDDHGASRAIVPRDSSRDTNFGTSSIIAPPSTPTGSFSLPPGDRGTPRAIVPRASRNMNVGTPSIIQTPSTVTGCSLLPIDDHGTRRAIVPWASRNTTVGTPSIIQPSSLSTIVEESSVCCPSTPRFPLDHGNG
ncbi:hypothetical protein BKA80DRAFT_101014 [Phyllosticta citrichinensis]